MAIETNKPLEHQENGKEDLSVSKIDRVAGNMKRRITIAGASLSASLPMTEPVGQAEMVRRQFQLLDSPEQQETLAAQAYMDGLISKAQALELLATDRRSFEDMLNQRGLPAVRPWTQEDIDMLEQ